MGKLLFQTFFGCGHSKTTFPLTPSPGAETYVACLECGKELPYDWENMRRIKASLLARPVLKLRRIALPSRVESES
jgi:hypothetical protein